MKLSSTVLLSALLTSASAWDLEVFMTDGRRVRTHGTLNSGCVNYDFAMNRAVNRAVFHDSAFADTFELYANANCDNLIYRNGEGDHRLAVPRVIRSYKVY